MQNENMQSVQGLLTNIVQGSSKKALTDYHLYIDEDAHLKAVPRNRRQAVTDDQSNSLITLPVLDSITLDIPKMG